MPDEVTEIKGFQKRQDIPVGHFAGKLRVAVAGEQLDTVGCHGGARKCGGIVTSLGVGRRPKRCNFFAIHGHGPLNRMRRKVAPSENAATRRVRSSPNRRQGLNFNFARSRLQPQRSDSD